MCGRVYRILKQDLYQLEHTYKIIMPNDELQVMIISNQPAFYVHCVYAACLFSGGFELSVCTLQETVQKMN